MNLGKRIRICRCLLWILMCCICFGDGTTTNDFIMAVTDTTTGVTFLDFLTTDETKTTKRTTTLETTTSVDTTTQTDPMTTIIIPFDSTTTFPTTLSATTNEHTTTMETTAKDVDTTTQTNPTTTVTTSDSSTTFPTTLSATTNKRTTTMQETTRNVDTTTEKNPTTTVTTSDSTTTFPTTLSATTNERTTTIETTAKDVDTTTERNPTTAVTTSDSTTTFPTTLSATTNERTTIMETTARNVDTTTQTDPMTTIIIPFDSTTTFPTTLSATTNERTTTMETTAKDVDTTTQTNPTTTVTTSDSTTTFPTTLSATTYERTTTLETTTSVDTTTQTDPMTTIIHDFDSTTTFPTTLSATTHERTTTMGTPARYVDTTTQTDPTTTVTTSGSTTIFPTTLPTTTNERTTTMETTARNVDTTTQTDPTTTVTTSDSSTTFPTTLSATTYKRTTTMEETTRNVDTTTQTNPTTTTVTTSDSSTTFPTTLSATTNKRKTTMETTAENVDTKAQTDPTTTIRTTFSSTSFPTTKVTTETARSTDVLTTELRPTTHGITSDADVTTHTTTAFIPTTIFVPCPAEIITYSGVQLSFPKTEPEDSVTSSQKCSNDSTNPEQPLASRLCTEVGWEDPELETCFSAEDAEDEIERIANTTITEENVEEVASELALITTQTEDLDASEIDSVADSLESISNANSSSPEVTESVLGTVNNLMEVDETELVEADASTSVINSLEQQVSNVQENPENFTDVQDNVGVKAVKFDPELTKSITFINLIPEEFTGSDVLNTDLSEENAQLYNERSEVLLNRSASSIYIPSNILEIALQEQPNLTQVPISFFLYKDSRLFQTSKKPPTGSPDLNVTLREAILSQVIAATLEIDNVVVENLPPNSSVISRFQLSESLNANETILYRKCVFWVSPERSAEDSYWSEEGCHMTVDGNQTVCTCNHLTSFAVLVGIGTALPPAAMITLTVITWVGSCLSITGLIVCCLTLVLIRKLRRKQASQIHLNLFVCLIGFYVTFLVGDLLKDNPVHCKNVAASIQYFCLATVGWMSAEAVNMYYRLVRRKNIAYFIPISCVIIYGLSLVPVIVVFTISTFESEGYCFLPPGNSLYYGFLLEILIMTLFNMIIFSIVVRKVVFRPVMSTSSTSSRKEVISRIQMLVTFWILLGLSWSFGFLAVIPNRKTITFEVLFCIFTSLQGLILVVTIYVKNPEIHEAFKGTKKLFWMKIGSSDMKSTNSDGVPSFSELVKLQSFKKSGELKNASKTDSYSTKDNN